MRFLRDDTGATAIEYGLIATIVCIGIIVALGGLRDGLNNIFSNVSTLLSEIAALQWSRFLLVLGYWTADDIGYVVTLLFDFQNNSILFGPAQSGPLLQFRPAPPRHQGR